VLKCVGPIRSGLFFLARSVVFVRGAGERSSKWLIGPRTFRNDLWKTTLTKKLCDVRTVFFLAWMAFGASPSHFQVEIFFDGVPLAVLSAKSTPFFFNAREGNSQCSKTFVDDVNFWQVRKTNQGQSHFSPIPQYPHHSHYHHTFQKNYQSKPTKTASF